MASCCSLYVTLVLLQTRPLCPREPLRKSVRALLGLCRVSTSSTRLRGQKSGLSCPQTLNRKSWSRAQRPWDTVWDAGGTPSALLPGPLRPHLALDDEVPWPMMLPSQVPSHLSTCSRASVTLPGERQEATGHRPWAVVLSVSWFSGPLGSLLQDTG